VTGDDPYEYGDVYTLTAMESNRKLFINHHEFIFSKILTKEPFEHIIGISE